MCMFVFVCGFTCANGRIKEMNIHTFILRFSSSYLMPFPTLYQLIGELIIIVSFIHIHPVSLSLSVHILSYHFSLSFVSELWNIRRMCHRRICGSAWQEEEEEWKRYLILKLTYVVSLLDNNKKIKVIIK